MKKIKKAIFFLMLFIFGISSFCFSADSSASFTLTYTTPVQIQDVRPFSFSLVKKNGVNPSQSLTLGVNDYNTYFQNKTVTLGCFKVTGEPNSSVRINSITVPQVGPITITSSPRIIVADNCNPGSLNYHDGFPKTFTLSSTGEKYVVWGFTYYVMDTLDTFNPEMNLSSLSDGSWSVSANVSLQYN